jgi:hypothetical protein
MGLQLHPRGCLLGSWVEVLGPTSTCCHFFPYKLNFQIESSEMTSTQDVVLGAAACKTQRRRDKRERPKKIGKPRRKRLHILLNDTKKTFDGWKNLPEPWTFHTCEAYIEWCHIGKGFPHNRYQLQHKADKPNMHHCEWPIFKERCIEMCQHIYEKPFLECNECPLSSL